VLQAGWLGCCARLAGGSDSRWGADWAGRTTARWTIWWGSFDTLVLRRDVSVAPNARAGWAVRTGNLLLASHQEVPFERLGEVLTLRGSLARHPLFPVMLAFRTTRRAL